MGRNIYERPEIFKLMLNPVVTSLIRNLWEITGNEKIAVLLTFQKCPFFRIGTELPELLKLTFPQANYNLAVSVTTFPDCDPIA